jgi:cytochrome P450
MLGAEASQFVTVAGAENFSWRQGMAGEQRDQLLGDGLITTDGEYHDRARRIMMPAFHRRRMDSAVTIMVEESAHAVGRWREGEQVELYGWARELAMGIAMRALVGFDPHDSGLGREATDEFERALAFYDSEPWMMMLRGPGTPWARMQAARRRLDAIVHAEIERRRRAIATTGEAGEDVLSMLLSARDEDGTGLSDGELRDQLMTLLFGGHDTSASTISFLMYELARNPEALARVRAEQERVLGDRPPTADHVTDRMPELALALEETLRLYPPVWFGARRAIKAFDFGPHRIPAGTHVIYSPWATHRLPDVYTDPDRFIPDRFAPDARQAIPKGGYIPFGAGQRICIGKRFGQMIAMTVATVLLQRVRLEPALDGELQVAAMGTLSPRAVPMLVRAGP